MCNLRKRAIIGKEKDVASDYKFQKPEAAGLQIQQNGYLEKYRVRKMTTIEI